MNRSLLIVALAAIGILIAPVARADAQEDAQKVLAEKQAARDKSRAVMVQVSTGELEDLKSKVTSLQAQVDFLKGQIAKASAANAPPKALNEIELGMTKEQVKTFIAQHKYEYSLVGIKASTGVAKSTAEVTVKESGNATIESNGQRTTHVGPAETEAIGNGRIRQVSGNGQARGTAEGTRRVEVTTNTGMHEVMEIARVQTVQRAVGSHADVLGGMHNDYGNVTERVGTISVTLDNNIVTGIDAN